MTRLPPADPMPTAGPPALVRHGAAAYAQALSGAGGRQLEARMRPGDRGAVCAAIYASPPYDLQVPALPVARLSINLTRAVVSGGIEGERPRRYEAGRYSTFLAPAGAAAAWRKEVPSRHLNLYFHPELLDAGDGGPGVDREQPLCNLQVAGIRSLADELAAELDRPGLATAEAVDSLARLILVRLLRQRQRPGRPAQPLTPRMLARLREFVGAHLTERILVTDLAREAGLSPNRFAQAFTAVTGESPHRFVMNLRLQRAAALLRGGDLPLVAVAHDCGFANQQHLTNLMRRHLGVTPGRYRQAHRPGGDAG